MCGIAGFVGRGDRGVLERMTAAIAYRGPDADGHWVSEAEGVFFGHRRLAIVDLEDGAQPMWTGDGELGIIFNGEIYNHGELRRELEAVGAKFQSDHSDTEVLLHAYREWGEGMVERLNGMWALVIYDRGKRRLFGSRDRFGKKPLYYFQEGETLAFASELPALLAHPQAPRSLSMLSLKKYFAYGYIPAPRSIYERVWKLPGGHSFRFDLRSGVLEVFRWWEFILEPVSSPPDIDSLCEEIRDTLDRAVKRRMISDVPLGVFLSGGVDSSAIAALAAKHLPAGQLNTFSIGFSDPSFDESVYAKKVADQLQTRHWNEILDLDQSVALLPEILSRLDEPTGDGSLLPTYLLSRFAREKVTVALGGDGGDELFAGYDPFRALRMAECYSKWIPRPVHRAISLLAAQLPVSHRNISFDFKVKRTLLGLNYRPQLWNPVWMGPLDPAGIGEFFREPCDEEEVYSEAIVAWDRTAHLSTVDRTLEFFTKIYLQDGILAKVDRASMLCSLEARSPFLDLEVVNLARRIPWEWKLRDGQTKWILKRALAPLLPREIIHRKKKGFGMPIGRWLREGKFPVDAGDAIRGMDGNFLERAQKAHLSGKSDQRLFLWSYWVFHQWNQK